MIPCPRCGTSALGSPGAVPMRRAGDGAEVYFHELCFDLEAARLRARSPEQRERFEAQARASHAERLVAAREGSGRRLRR